nr:hypothetical protein [Nostoc sp. ChiQUE02]MDZ8232719.1 hypothetical protein [Nostoc sp. ChiQUE02]
MSSRGHTALSAIGGLKAVALHEGSLQWLQKDFTQVYCQCSGKDEKTLKPAPVQNSRRNPFEEIDDPITPEQWQEVKDGLTKVALWKKN